MTNKLTVQLDWSANRQKWIANFQGRTYKSASELYIFNSIVNSVGHRNIEFVKSGVSELQKTPDYIKDIKINVVNTAKPVFNVNQRFEFIKKSVSMVVNKVTPSLGVTGDGGLGKSHTIITTLQKKHGLMDSMEFPSAEKKYTLIKGFSTPKMVYRTLYDNRNSLIVWDDCDKVIEDKTAVNLLKGALDSFGKRYICWNAEARSEEEEKELPRKFPFEGSVIFISNKRPEEINYALKTRTIMIDVFMATDEKLDRMDYIINNPEEEFLPEYSIEEKMDAFGLISSVKHSIKELSLRTQIIATKIRAAYPNDWKDMATYVLTH